MAWLALGEMKTARLVAHNEKISCIPRFLKQSKSWPKKNARAFFPWRGSGERKSGPIVAGVVQVRVRDLLTNLHHFKPPRSTKRWVGLKYDELEKDTY
jgi:hypothetical protein